MVDNKTAHLGLPLPDLSNEQTEDVPRIGQALAMLDARAQSVDAALEVQSGEVQALKASDTVHDERLESLKQNLEQEAMARAAADREASGRLQTLSDTQTSLGLRVDSLDDTAAEQASRLEEVASTISSTSFVFIGHVFPLLATDSYVPEGCVPANGGEYTRDQFPTLYDDYLVGGKLITCTYAAWAAQMAQTGNCTLIALDRDAKKFKVPFYKDGDSITQASSAAEIGKSVKAGLPNLTGLPNLDGGNAVATGVFSSVMAGGFRPTGQYLGSTSVKFDASQNGTDPVYGKSTTVTDEQVRLRHFVVVASAQNSASMFDWSAYMAALAGKANVDLSNVTGNAFNFYLHVCDEKPSGTYGGSTSAATWQTRDLNTIRVNRIGASVANNKITLPAGRYFIRAKIPVYVGMNSRSALYNCTLNAFLLYSPSHFADYNYNGQHHIVLENEFTLAADAVLEIRMRVSYAYVYGMGMATGVSGVPEIYTEALIWKM